MGQNLSCATKPKPADASEKPKVVKQKKALKNGPEIKAKTVPATHAAPGEGIPVQREVSFLKSAPSHFKLPNVAVELQKDKAGQYSTKVTPVAKGDIKVVSLFPSNKHKDHPVDANPRSLAQDSAVPLCWKDLYWNIIGQKVTTTDEEKVSALFSWLVSKPLDEPFFASDDDKLKKKRKVSMDNRIDSPDVVLSKMALGKANYVQAFESMCRYSGIPCSTVRGIAKNMEYKVAQPLLQPGEQLFHPETGALPPSIASLQHYWNAALIDGTWRLFDVTWAAQRLARGKKETVAKTTQAMMMQYEADMFYYEVDPTELIFTHYPFEDIWQLIDPPVSIVKFATWPLLKPAFFQSGLSLFSHKEGFIPIETQLVLTLKMLPENVGKLMFTYQLNLEGFGNVDAGVSRTRFGIHEISQDESSVIFRFRMPKKGNYTLVIYSRQSGEQLFSDVCEYKITAMGTSKDDVLVATPFPPTAQANYGPTEKAIEYGLETLPRQLAPLVKSPDGGVELRFVAAEPEGKIPRLTARLKSVRFKDEHLENCILLRDIEASLPSTGVSMLTGMGPCVPMTVLNAFLPEKGEYAIEVYAAPQPSTSEDDAVYHLAWQFLIESESSKPLSPALRSRFGTINLGAQDETWHRLGFRTLSHPDPLIRIRTVGRAGAEKLAQENYRAQMLQRFMGSPNSVEESVEPALPVIEQNEAETGEAGTGGIKYDRDDADLKIIISLPEQQHICIIGQMVDISGDDEEDVTGYLLRRQHDVLGEKLSEDLASKRTSAEYSVEQLSQLVHFMVRIPRGGTFYKLYLYAIVAEGEVTDPIPLVYTYLIEAPLRLTAAESPYIGAIAGEFAENIERKQITQLSSSKFQRNKLPAT